MKKLIPFLIVACIIIPFSPWEDTHWPKWMMFHFVAAVILGFKYASKYTWAVGLGVFTSIFSAAQIITNRETFPGMHQILRIDMSNMSGKATVAFLLMLLLADYFKYDTLRNLIKSYFWICTFHCFYVLYQLNSGIDRDHSTGFLPNVSMGPCMLAVLYPLLIFMREGNRAYTLMRYIALILFPIIIVREGSSVAWATFCIGLAAMGFQMFDLIFEKKIAFLYALFIIALCFLFGSQIDPNFYRFDKVSRFDFWPKIFKEWWDNGSILFGMGTGSFRHLGPNLQQKINLEVGQWWYWAHNDWLQILFETGILGFISAVCVWLQCVIRSYRSLDFGLSSSLIALSVVGFGNYFLRLAEFCFLVMILIAIPLKYYGEYGSNKRMVSNN